MEEAFLRAIADAPEDCTARLVFADWLAERGGLGDSAWAEFIRLTVGQRERTFWPPGSESEEATPRSETDRATELCRENWQDWTVILLRRLADSPLRRWLGTGDCRWGYRRGLVAVFEGTQQVLLDAWDDLFRLGPVEEVQVHNLWYLGMVLSLYQFLDRPSMRVLRLRASELRDDCVDQLQRVSDWLRGLDRVELVAQNPNQSTARRLVAWLVADPSLRHVHWRGQAIQ
jgi:uncharacterized protein (TIGR02996 family)